VQSRVPFASGYVDRVVLDNGLTLLIHEDHSAPVVTVQTWFRVGSRHERPGKTGLAHLFEHLMFNETKSLRAGAFDAKLEAVGAESNAATWVDWTYYYQSVPKENLKLVLKLESERMQNLVLRDKQVASELEVVSNERRYRVDDDVDGAASELLYKTAFPKNAYGWPTIGWMEDIKAFTPEDCEAFYRTYYAPNNALLVVCGDIKKTAVVKLVSQFYGAISSSKIPAEDVIPEAPQVSERTAELTKPTTNAKIYIGYRGPAFGDLDHAALSVLNEVLFGSRSARGYQELVAKKELVTEVRGWVSTFHYEGLYDISASCRSGIEESVVLRELDALLEQATRELISDAELDAAKARLELALLQGMDTIAGRAEQIGFYDIMVGDPAGAFRKLEQYQRVSASDLRMAARKYLRTEARTRIHVHPEAP
jgi:zinc protease